MSILHDILYWIFLAIGYAKEAAIGLFVVGGTLATICCIYMWITRRMEVKDASPPEH